MNLSIKNLWKPVVIAIALAFLYGNVLAKLGLDWWTDENYSHGLLVPFLIGYIVWLEFDKLKNTSQNSSAWLGFSGILAAIFLLLAGTLGAELFTQRISFYRLVCCFWRFQFRRLYSIKLRFRYKFSLHKWLFGEFVCLKFLRLEMEM
jgi:hypothetical protein